MPSLEFRCVGQDRLPTRLSEFDVERYFALTDSDVVAVNERFRRDRRAGVAIQLIFLRASGHTLDHVGTLPRQLPRYARFVGEAKVKGSTTTLRRMGPAHFAHVNFRGTLSFPINRYRGMLLDAAPWRRVAGS